MGNRRFTQVATSDDEDDAPPSNTKEELQNRRKRKKLKLSEVEEEEQEQEQERGRKKRAREKEKPASSGEDDDEAAPEDAKSIGDIVRVSGKGRGRRRHYESFEYDGNRYDLLGFAFGPKLEPITWGQPPHFPFPHLEYHSVEESFLSVVDSPCDLPFPLTPLPMLPSLPDMARTRRPAIPALTEPGLIVVIASFCALWLGPCPTWLDWLHELLLSSGTLWMHSEDSVLLVPEESNQKPYVAIIKDITQGTDRSMMVTGQWFYRPEEAEKKGGGNWQSRDSRELFYSFHRDEVPAESVMHKCVVHFIPRNKQIPNRKQHPGFIVQKVYDTEQRRLFKLTDKDYEDNKQHEIDVLVQKTLSRVGDLPDIETEDAFPDQEDSLKNKRILRRKNMSPLDVSRDDEATTKSGQPLKAETPGSVTSTASEYYNILSNFKALTGETQRDKWLDKLLQGIQFICSHMDSWQSDDKEKGGSHGMNQTYDGSQEKIASDDKTFVWPDAAVPAITALEKASHDALSSDFQKYNQKMRQLLFNLKVRSEEIPPSGQNKSKTSPVLHKLLPWFDHLYIRELSLVNRHQAFTHLKEITPPMAQGVVKKLGSGDEGLTAEELASKEPEKSEHMQLLVWLSKQMTDARCKRCTEKKVGVIDIIQSGLRARYQVKCIVLTSGECIACGNTWYASRDEALTLTIDGPSSAKTVGTAPLATAKFEDVEKKLLSPGNPRSRPMMFFKKTTEAYMPVLDTQKSFNKPRTENNTAAIKAVD
ncbi:bromo-adjacent homology (BAH) domain-containing protein [Actinidia rufa]|uniref:Bromo-adjacent homology (BAH) domain-containing protein n=1 Tax=Actinidia rufa TaxID=165716 RepID=A0A7J0FSL0_9ERIC|nr:bromo-adjacent homology (BAH) domain-containing protein [Actinidia rufa]